MAKPTIEDTRWAVTAGGADSALISNPDSTLKDNGYGDSGPTSVPTNRDWNWWHRKAHSWFQYLNAGAFNGASSFDNALAVAGSLSCGNLTVTGDASVTGHVAAAGTVSGSDLGFGQRPMTISSWAFRSQVAGATTPKLNDLARSGSPDGWTDWVFDDHVIAWLPLDVGDTIDQITWSYAKAGSGASMVFEIIELSDFGSISPVDTLFDTSSGAGFIQTTRSPNLTLTGVRGFGLRVSSNTAAHVFQNCRIVYHRSV